jgi:hypothetical protein
VAKKKKNVPEPPPSVKRVANLPGILASAEGKPSWRFSSACRDGDWAWGEAATVAFLSFSHQYESMTWPEIFKGGNAGKLISTDHLPSPAQAELARISHDDVDDLVELRFSGLLRAWGVRHGSVLCLLWWDPDHTVFPSYKKHT